jgi:hypothetical protein
MDKQYFDREIVYEMIRIAIVMGMTMHKNSNDFFICMGLNPRHVFEYHAKLVGINDKNTALTACANLIIDETQELAEIVRDAHMDRKDRSV